MSVQEQLDVLEERLEDIDRLLDDGDYEGARQKAMGLSDILDCPLCKNIENGVLGGIMFAAGMTPEGRERRADAVRDEIRLFIDVTLPEARKHLEDMPEEEVVTGP